MKKKTAKKKSAKKKTKKRGSIRRYSSGSVTRSQRGRGLKIGSGWTALYHGGRTGSTKHDKVWQVRITKKGSGWVVQTRHGRRTGQQNETTSKVMSKLAAIKHAARKFDSKMRKGYQIIRLRRRSRGRA